MRMFKKHSDTLSAALDSEEISKIKDLIGEDAVRGWSVFDHDGVELASESVSETVDAPTLTFMKGLREMQAETLGKANVIILRDKFGSAGREVRHGR